MASIHEAAPVARYSNIAVAFHWTTVVLVLVQLWLGFAFHAADPGPERTELFTWHKTAGALILLITLARLGYRLVNPPPPFSSDLPGWEQRAATWNHRLFYALLIALPLTGLVAVSAHEKGATTELAGGIPLPVIPGVSEAAGDVAGGVHIGLVFLLLAAILIHAGAALKNQFVARLPVAGRMPPFQAPGRRPTVIGQGSRAHPARG